MAKHGEFKISLSNPMDDKILNSTTNGRNSVRGEGGSGSGVFDVGCVKCSGKVIMRVHRIHTGLFNMGASW